MAAHSLSGTIYVLLKQHELEGAKKYIDIYQEPVMKGDTAYNRLGMLYYFYGSYHLHAADYASAIYYFRRQLQMAQYQGIQSADSGCQFDDDILNDSLVRKLHKQAAQGKAASDADMRGLVELVYRYAPHFFENLSHLSPALSQKRTYICMLAKLRFAPATVASLMGLSAQAVSNHRSFLSKTLFHCPTTDFDFKIRQL